MYIVNEKSLVLAVYDLFAIQSYGTEAEFGKLFRWERPNIQQSVIFTVKHLRID